MKTYTIKQPIFELHEADGWQGKRWYANNVEHYFYIYYDTDNPLPYLIRYSFNDYMDEDGERFKTLDEAKEFLIGNPPPMFNESKSGQTFFSSQYIFTHFCNSFQ